MKRVLLAPAVFLTVLSLLLASCGGTALPAHSPSAEKTPPALYVAMVRGQVETRNKAGEGFIPVQAGQKLGVGAEIRTSEKSAVVLYRDTLSMVALDQNSVMLVKKLAFKSSLPVTILSLLKGAAVVEHKGKLPRGAVLAIETAEGRQGGVSGSIVRVSYFPSEKRTITACLSGECSLTQDGQTLKLAGAQEADVDGSNPLPAAQELSTTQREEFLETAHLLCDCALSLEEILEAGVTSFAPPPDEVPTPEEDLEASADEYGNTDPENDQISEDDLAEIFGQFSEEELPAENGSAEQEGAPPAGNDEGEESPAPEPPPAEPSDPSGSGSAPQERPEEPPPTGGG